MPVLNPSPGTIQLSATDFIKSSLRLVGALRSGLNLTAAELTDCQTVANSMLDAFSIERVLIPAVAIISLNTAQVPLSLVANKASYLLGNVLGTEDFLLPRPSRLERVSIMYSASQSTPVEIAMENYDDVEWQAVANKSTTSLLPQGCHIDESNAVFPDTQITFWPVPTQANPVILYLWQMLQQFTSLTAKYLFPPGYTEMIRFNLAVRLAAEFPCDMQKFTLVEKLAGEAKGRVAGINVRPLEAVCDPALTGPAGLGNIFTGTANRRN
jgi:hypothetical protein